MKHRERGSSFRWIDGGWIEVRFGVVTLWWQPDDAETMEPMFTVARAELLAALGAPRAARPPKPRRRTPAVAQLQLPMSPSSTRPR